MKYIFFLGIALLPLSFKGAQGDSDDNFCHLPFYLRAEYTLALNHIRSKKPLRDEFFTAVGQFNSQQEEEDQGLSPWFCVYQKKSQSQNTQARRMPVPFWLEAILKGNEVAFMQLLEKYPYIFLETHKMAFLSYVAESYAAESYLPESYVGKLGFSVDFMRKIVAHIKQKLPSLDENPFGKVDAAVDALPLALVPGSACAEIRELFLEETSSVQNLCLEHFDSSVRVMRARMITENSDHLLDSKYLKDDLTKEGIQEMLKVFVDRDLHCGIKNYLESLEVLKRREKEDEKGMIWTEDNTIDICTAMLTYFSKDFESKCELIQSESAKSQNLSETTKIFLKALFSTTAKHLDKSLIEKRLKEKIETLDIPPINKDELLEAINSVLDDRQEKPRVKRYKKSS